MTRYLFVRRTHLVKSIRIQASRRLLLPLLQASLPRSRSLLWLANQQRVEQRAARRLRSGSVVLPRRRIAVISKGVWAARSGLATTGSTAMAFVGKKSTARCARRRATRGRRRERGAVSQWFLLPWGRFVRLAKVVSLVRVEHSGGDAQAEKLAVGTLMTTSQLR